MPSSRASCADCSRACAASFINTPSGSTCESDIDDGNAERIHLRIFRSTPLAEALAEMNRYANPPLRLGDARLASTPISGTLRVGDSASMALALSALLPLQAQPQGDGTILLTPKVGG